MQQQAEAAGARPLPADAGTSTSASRPDMQSSAPKRQKVAFANDEDVPQAETPAYEAWAAWRDSAGGTLRAFLTDEAVAKMAADYHVTLMQRRLNQAGVDVAVGWAAPGKPMRPCW